MNDVLSDRLQALRTPPPGNGFERRLEQALWREAQVLRAERNAMRPGMARVRRWGGRTGLAMVLVLGATAAAAAGGSVWVWIASDERAVAPAPTPPMKPVEGTQRAAAAKVRVEPAAQEHAAELVPAAAPPTDVGVSKKGLPEAAPLQREAPRQAARFAKAASAAEPPRVHLPERSAPAPVLPLELPAREISGVTSGGSQTSGSSALAPPDRAAGAAASDRRSLPELRSRADRRRNRSERSERERAAEPPGRAIARERSGRDNAERGLERAREAHERK